MSEDRRPALSLSRATKVGPGKVHDLGTILARHSLVAWIDDGRQGSRALSLFVWLELSHDGVHWVRRGRAQLAGGSPFIVTSWYTLDEWWPAKYVRANILDWPEGTTGLVSATIAST